MADRPRKRTEYFSQFSRKDQLGLLSFCDKLRPGLLAEVLGRVSKKNPDLPIFNSPDWAALVPRHLSRPRSLSIEPAGPRHPRASLPPCLPNGMSSTGTTTSSPAISTMAGPSCLRKPDMADPFKHGPDDAEVPADDDDDLLPPTWPKDAEGEGFYRLLGAERHDAAHLVDVRDDTAHPGYEAMDQDTNGNICYNRVSCTA
jgi:hypothetical protein